MYVRLVHLWGARAKHAVIMRIPSSTLPRRAAYLSDGPTHGYHAWPPLWPRRAVCALLKTCNQLSGRRSRGEEGFDHRVGHSLLLLYDAKAPHSQKSKEFKGLGHYPTNIPVRLFLYHNKIYYLYNYLIFLLFL